MLLYLLKGSLYLLMMMNERIIDILNKATFGLGTCSM